MIPKSELAYLRAEAIKPRTPPDSDIRAGADHTLRFLDHIDELEEDRHQLRAMWEHERTRSATLETERDKWREKWQGATQNAAKAFEHCSGLEKSLENARKERDEAQRLLGIEQRFHAEDVAELAEVKKERDAALADNAAWHVAANKAAEHLDLVHPARIPLLGACRDGHPGAALLEELGTLRAAHLQYKADLYEMHKILLWAGEWPNEMPQPSRAMRVLLEEHRKALVRARNEGLEKAAAWHDAKAQAARKDAHRERGERMERRHQNLEWTAAPHDYYAKEIRALKLPVEAH